MHVKSPSPPPPIPGAPVVYGQGVHVHVNNMPSKMWPDGRKPDNKHPGQFVIDPMWYLDDQHSQLLRARSRLPRPGEDIVIGHLDNGLDGTHPAVPMKLVRGDRYANAVGLYSYEEQKSNNESPRPPLPPEQTGGTHGLGTAGILAGSWITIDEKQIPGGKIKYYDGWLGGAPYASVVPVRVAPWVFSVSTGELAYAIDYASRRKGADVITMSHGGSPTQAWADAVNAAYERGTAMFAAEGDFFSLMPEPLRPRGIFVPASPVYPAGFRRVIGVTGVTADHRSYACNSLIRLLSRPLDILKWMSRGSYGADGTSTSLLRPNDRPDTSESWRQGELRTYPLAAYSPNVPWLRIREEKGHRIPDGLDLDGSGTSASTPQVAAAAALWLQKHRHEFSAREWHQWQKAEAVYYALLKKADRGGKLGPDPYLGAGLLRASDALDLSYSEIRKAKRPPGRLDVLPPGSLWFIKAPNDYMDGARSFFGLIGWQKPGYVHLRDRLRLYQRPLVDKSRVAALERLYYNMMLLREWHGGDIPRNRDQAMYCARAWRKAEAVDSISTR